MNIIYESYNRKFVTYIEHKDIFWNFELKFAKASML